METVYLNNLNERVNINRLKADLNELCAKFGSVREVMAKKSLRMRGQAFVLFANPEEAQQAVEGLTGHEFHGKPIKAALARQKSDSVVKNPDEVTERKHQRKRSAPSPAPRSSKRSKASRNLGEPHRILFVEGLPTTITVEALQPFYEADPGFVEARVFAARGLGFVEFAQDADAAAVVNRPLVIDGQEAVVSFAKK